ncbi:MAG TPA: hypothetical protein VJV75_02250 [Candidatus Polarisedimenticolia bacterium]|nr:hypothetical protein [Candidatus Polarisedimenticolia bacterium]
MRKQTMGGVALLAAAAMVAVLGLAPAMAGTEGKWLHIRVLGGDDGSVKVNLPVAVLETMADAIEADHFSNGQIHLSESNIKPEQLRSVWQSLKNSRDMEFVTVESDDQNVRVAKSGNFLVVKVNDADRKRGKDTVDIKVPVEVVDALLQAPEGQLNVKAALQALANYGGGDLVQVTDGESHVRIWIDGRSDSTDI